MVFQGKHHLVIYQWDFPELLFDQVGANRRLEIESVFQADLLFLVSQIVYPDDYPLVILSLLDG